MSEQTLLQLFQDLNINLGKVQPRVVKAWFDTDCAEMLNWLCTSLTKECYISPQEEKDFAACPTHFEGEQLDKKMQQLEKEHPNIFNLEENLLDIEIAKDEIEILEEQLNEQQKQIRLNEKIHSSLVDELSKLASEEMDLQLIEEETQNKYEQLAQELDAVNKQIYNQLQKYSSCLINYETAAVPQFANMVDLTDTEELLMETINSLNLSTIRDNINDGSDTLPIIFTSKLNEIVLKMEIEGINAALSFMDKNDPNALSLTEQEDLVKSIEQKKEEQLQMLQMIEEMLPKQVESDVSKPIHQYLTNNLNSLNLKMDTLKKCSDGFKVVLSYLVILENLLVLEKNDITDSFTIFKDIRTNIVNSIHESQIRKDAMLKITSKHEDRESELHEDEFLESSVESCSLSEIVNKFEPLKNMEMQLKSNQISQIFKNHKSFKQIKQNIKKMETFLVSGPNAQFVTIPQDLQLLIRKADQSLISQASAVKLGTQLLYKKKETFAKDRMLQIMGQLWSFFMTDEAKFLSLFNQLMENSH